MRSIIVSGGQQGKAAVALNGTFGGAAF